MNCDCDQVNVSSYPSGCWARLLRFLKRCRRRRDAHGANRAIGVGYSIELPVQSDQRHRNKDPLLSNVLTDELERLTVCRPYDSLSDVGILALTFDNRFAADLASVGQLASCLASNSFFRDFRECD